MSRLGNLGAALYRGEVSIDFVGRRKIWYTASALILVFAIAGLLIRGLHLGVEFTGGTVLTFPAGKTTESQVVSVVRDSGVDLGTQPPIVQKAGTNWRVTTESLTTDESTKVKQSISTKLGVAGDDIASQAIGSTWGGQVSSKALQGLVVFLIIVVIYLSMAFEWKMAVAAIVALAHDLIITVGIYAWSGFEVTPATVIGFLTILGYSLYDTVVVFDKVRENTAGIWGGARQTYSQAANLAVNQTLVRSINTSVIALLPVAGILFIGTTFLGAGTLKDLALALFVGMLAGTVSSIFIATPLLAQLKEMEPKFQALAKRVAAREAGAGARPPTRPAGASRTASAGKSVATGRATAVEESTETAAAAPRSGAKPKPVAVRRQQQARRKGGKKKRR